MNRGRDHDMDTIAPTLSDFDKPGAFPTTTTTKISVRFVPFTPVHLPIKKQNMKTSHTHHQPDARMELAAHLENFALPPTTPLAASTSAMPRASREEKLDSSPKAARTDKHFYVARATSPGGLSKTVPPSRKQMHIYENPLEGLRNTEFRMEAPSAKTVRLAGDFTEWEKSPLDMVQSYDGTWFTIVPLLPGTYSYRFIVDGQWLDDPHSTQHIPNPFGSEDAVMSVD